jgi:uncharacterized protein (DUF952 family)
MSATADDLPAGGHHVPGALTSGRIYHLALAGEWAEATASGRPYDRSTVGRSLAEEGFIHCSFADQVQGVADRFYAGRSDVVLLTVEVERLDAEVRVESVPGAGAFPHVFGPIPLAAVAAAVPVPVGPDGRLFAGALAR